MAEPPRKRATYDDLRALPDRLVGEIVRGELRALPRPAPRHAWASSRLGERIGGPFNVGGDGPGGWVILDEPEIHFPDGDVLVPDLAGWRSERMPALPDTAYFTTVPDWVCEVLSPSTEADDRADKMPIYVGAGVTHAWLIDPIVRTLEVYRRDEARWMLVGTHKGSAAVRAEPFEAVELTLGALWA